MWLNYSVYILIKLFSSLTERTSLKLGSHQVTSLQKCYFKDFYVKFASSMKLRKRTNKNLKETEDTIKILSFINYS